MPPPSPSPTRSSLPTRSRRLRHTRPSTRPPSRPRIDSVMEGLKEIQKLEGHTDRVWSLAWNPLSGLDGAPLKLASCSGDKTVRIWEHKPSNSWECQVVLDDPHTRTVRSCDWSPSGKLLATASFDGTTAIFQDVGDDYECVSTLEGHENEVKSVSWNASGSLLATCGRDKTMWIWEVLPGNEFECVAVLQGHTQDEQNAKEKLLFVQLPPTLPLVKRPTSAKGKEKVRSSAPSEKVGAARKGGSLEELSEGYMGKMQVYKSGAVKFKLGDALYDVSPGSDCTFAQDVAAINTAARKCCVLGELGQRVVITPDVDSLLDATIELD